MSAAAEQSLAVPDMTVSARQVFGIDADLDVPAFSEPDEHVPPVDQDYLFDRETTLAILAGFARTAASWSPAITAPESRPTSSRCRAAELAVRARQPGQPHQPHRPGRQGRIVVRDDHQVTEFRDGILPWALQHNVALCFDEYDAGPAGRDVRDPARAGGVGRLTLLDQNRVIRPHPAFRLFATRNTVGLGDTSGLSRHAADQSGADGPLVDRHRR
jgi:cobaltochelatase CobS